MKTIPIVLPSDENYAPYLCASMYSILVHTKSFIKFFILDGGIKLDSKRKIENSLKLFDNFSVEYIDMAKYNLKKFPDTTQYSVNTFSRYFISELSLGFDKVLYLDSDTIVNSDISELYDEDLEMYPIGVVLEDFYKKNAKYIKDYLYSKFSSDIKSFNAGVMLIAVPKFREGNYIDLLLEKTFELADKLSCPDQDIFNIIFDNNYKILDYKYNFMPDLKKFYYREKKFKEIYDKNYDNAVVYHYVSGKPWYLQSVKSVIFWKYLLKTDFKYFCIFNIPKYYYNKYYSKILKFVKYFCPPIYEILTINKKLNKDLR